MSNQKMTIRGYNWDHENESLKEECDDLHCEMPFSDQGKKTSGMPVTIEAFSKMIKKFADEVAKNPSLQLMFQDIIYVSFSKASMFRLLAQEECEHIGMFFAIPGKEGKLSLSLVALKQDLKPVKNELVSEILDNPSLFDATDARIPLMEEKGNGGTTFPFESHENLISLRKQFLSYLNENPPMVEGQYELDKFFNDYVYTK